jgi:putative transposase
LPLTDRGVKLAELDADQVDELHMKWPFCGSRKLTLELQAEGRAIHRKRVQRLMPLMGIESVAPKPATSRPAPEHPVYPYLLRKLEITGPDHVWATDITYIPMAWLRLPRGDHGVV